LREQGLLVKREFPTPWGICDLVGCSLNKNKVRRRLHLKQTRPIRSQLRVHLLSLIPEEGQGSAGVDELHRVFEPYLDKDRIELEIQRLAKDRFVKPADNGTFCKVNGWMPLHKRLVAVELKLARVNEALHQAVNNLGFADESYVGLPADIAQRLVQRQKKGDFQTEGVGILAVTPQSCRVVLSPRRCSIRSGRVVQGYSVERFWLPHLKGSEA
jgi:hypothetical protein